MGASGQLRVWGGFRFEVEVDLHRVGGHQTNALEPYDVGALHATQHALLGQELEIGCVVVALSDELEHELLIFSVQPDDDQVTLGIECSSLHKMISCNLTH